MRFKTRKQFTRFTERCRNRSRNDRQAPEHSGAFLHALARAIRTGRVELFVEAVWVERARLEPIPAWKIAA